MSTLTDLVLLAVFLLVTGVSCFLGLFLGRRVGQDRAPDHNHLGTIQGAMLGLLGLLLGFSFSGAMGRFTDRQDALAREANAIETAFERSELLPTKAQIQAALRSYLDRRVDLYRDRGGAASARIRSEMEASYAIAWSQTLTGVDAERSYASVAVTGMQAVGDALGERDALERRRLPAELIIVLVACSCLTMGAIGYGVGLAERRSVGLALTLATLIAVTLFVTVDFDRPRGGFIRLDAAPLLELQAKLSGK
jgi:hypothetical protein